MQEYWLWQASRFFRAYSQTGIYSQGRENCLLFEFLTIRWYSLNEVFSQSYGRVHHQTADEEQEALPVINF